MYYEKLLPIIYSRFFGILGIARKITALGIGLFRPMMRQVSEADMRVVVHKSCGWLLRLLCWQWRSRAMTLAH